MAAPTHSIALNAQSRRSHQLARLVAHTLSVMALKKTIRSSAVHIAPNRKALTSCAIVLENAKAPYRGLFEPRRLGRDIPTDSARLVELVVSISFVDVSPMVLRPTRDASCEPIARGHIPFRLFRKSQAPAHRHLPRLGWQLRGQYRRCRVATENG